MSSLRSRSVPIASLVFLALAALATAQTTQVDPNAIRFTQRTAGGSAPGEPPRTPGFRASMQGGKWIGAPLDAVRINGQLVSLDNTRLALAQELGFKQVPVVEYAPTDRLPAAQVDRFRETWESLRKKHPNLPEPKTWADAVRIRSLSNRLPANGTATRPHLAGDPKPAPRAPLIEPSPQARQTFQALDALADSRGQQGRTLTPTEITQQKQAGGAGRIAQDLLGEKPTTGTYTRRTYAGPGSDAPNMQPAAQRRGRPTALENARFTRPGPLNQFMESPISRTELNRLYQEALTKSPNGGPVKLSNGQTWLLDRATGDFKPLSGPGVVQLTGQEVKHLDQLRQALRGGAKPVDALQALAKEMAASGTQLSPEMARALKTLGRTNDFLPDEIAAALEKQLPKLDRVQGATKDMVTKAESVAKGRAFKILKYGGRTLLVVAIAADAYEIYVAEDRARATTKVVSGWGGALAAGGAAGTYMSPSLFTGPWGWAAYGVTVAGAGVLGYIVGENVGEVVYDSVFTKAGGSQ